MTLRARPVVRGPGRSGWNSGDRRTTLLNLGFAIAIGVSIVILIGYAAWSWYDDHYGSAATVNGTTITKDDLRARLQIEVFRIRYTEARIRTLQNAGRLTAAQADSQVQFLNQRLQSIGPITVERLIDVTLQRELAEQEGVTVTDADIDAQLLEEATTKEGRHAWVIEVEPIADEDTGEPGDAEKTAARLKAEAALAQLRAGKTWEDVAKTVSTATSAAQNGDLGFIELESGYDEAFTEAIFAANQNEPTDVVLGEDGIYRIGRVTEIAPETVDQAFEAKLAENEIELADYREAVRGDVIRTKLDEKIVADLSAPAPQRHVLEIFIPAPSTPLPDGVKVRHILYAPNDDPGAAGDLEDSDPAWAAAEAEAKAAYEALLDDPSKFDQMARTESDESVARTTGGKQPFYDATSAIDEAFKTAILADGLEPGDLIAPFKSEFGWHVVQFLRPYGEGDKAWLEDIREQVLDGAAFEDFVVDNSEGEEAKDGGDLGWIARGQLGELREEPIFNASVGGVSVVVEIPEEGTYLYKVLEEETRPADEEQIAIFESNAFSSWYTAKKADAEITRSGEGAGDATS